MPTDEDYRKNIDLSLDISSISCAIGGSGVMVYPVEGYAVITDLKGKEPDRRYKLTAFKHKIMKDGSTTYTSAFSHREQYTLEPYFLNVNDKKLNDTNWSRGALTFHGLLDDRMKQVSESFYQTSEKCMVINMKDSEVTDSGIASSDVR